jgi:hypothetical protein
LPRPRSFCDASPTAANASLTSITFRSSSATSLFATAARIALAGCSCRLLSGPPRRRAPDLGEDPVGDAERSAAAGS